MDTKRPVGDQHPPCESAPENESTENRIPAAPVPADGPPLSAAPPEAFHPYTYTPPVQREAAPFTASRADGILAIGCLVLGYLGIRWVVWGGFAGWGVTVFAALSAAAVLAYAAARHVKPTRASWFWLGIYLLVGLSYSLWPAGLLAPYKGLLLVGAAVY